MISSQEQTEATSASEVYSPLKSFQTGYNIPAASGAEARYRLHTCSRFGKI